MQTVTQRATTDATTECAFYRVEGGDVVAHSTDDEEYPALTEESESITHWAAGVENRYFFGHGFILTPGVYSCTGRCWARMGYDLRLTQS